jgi:transposase
VSAFFILMKMAHHDTSIRERVIVFSDEGGLSASTADELYGIQKSIARAWIQKYPRFGQIGRRRGTGLGRISSPAPDVALVNEAQKNPFVRVRNLKAAAGLQGPKTRLF